MVDTAENNVTPISADSKLSDEEKREQLRARIEAGEQRNEERSLADQAKDAADSALEFTKAHPFAVVGGVLLAGLAIGAMTRRGRRLGRRGGVLAGLATDAAMAYGARMIDGVLDGAQYAGDRIEDIGDSASTTARGLRRDAAYKLDVAGDALRSSGRKATRKGSRAYRALRTRITH
ncbi:MULTISPECIES: hypothetical protein [unclassified Erythrobacter]|jgi:ElaB/YqjD/DUF883 family membrane-anchored ribosome-binding protein|uniref:hypothetical protein n=1 Tax=Erythrobacteraceae TaxID=335929 RepID=UPI00076C2931|nr:MULTISPECIES: hypothetical protein [unclassified Erythrobacter]KWV95926.1 hypothetical protein ASS64_01495 [Erythrobacter sp. AP23]MBO6526753.1 hypothetical protein [Erythrobacter sp.]MBO6528426.1 hypothetical protein [Erythrobacter sp.]MBO6769547.1 hypothetical protein [Erythrobacter sp.]